MHFLLISENGFFHEIKRDGITSFPGIHEIQLYNKPNPGLKKKQQYALFLAFLIWYKGSISLEKILKI